MKESKLFLLLQEETGVSQSSAQIYLLRAAIDGGNYDISCEKIAESFIAEHWLYLHL